MDSGLKTESFTDTSCHVFVDSNHAFFYFLTFEVFNVKNFDIFGNWLPSSLNYTNRRLLFRRSYFRHLLSVTTCTTLQGVQLLFSYD